MESKAELRRAIKTRLERLSENDRRIESQILVRELRKLLGETPRTIGIYIPYLDEPNIRPLIEELLRNRWTVCMPHLEGNVMVMKHLGSLEDVVKNSDTGLFEPPGGSETIAPFSIDTVIVPGRAFTKEGIRLGRGNGGYDRWIEKLRKANPDAKCIGVCFECQVVQEIPEESHDQRVDVVMSARHIYEIRIE